MPKPRLFVQAGQRIGAGIVIEPEIHFPRPNSTRKDRGARLLCDCGNEYVAPMYSLVGCRADTMSCGCRQGRQPGEVIDRTNQRYGKLVVIELARIDGEARWFCRCDCGSQVVARGSCLARGITKSCGCSRLPPEGAARNALLRRYKSDARRRGLSWDLSDDDFARLTSLACFYCGIAPSATARMEKSRYVYNGIDRKDNSLGYTPENAAPCCKTCNVAKRAMPFDEFTAWIGRLAAHARMSAGGAP